MGTWVNALAVIGSIFILMLVAALVAAIYGLGQDRDDWHD